MCLVVCAWVRVWGGAKSHQGVRSAGVGRGVEEVESQMGPTSFTKGVCRCMIVQWGEAARRTWAPWQQRWSIHQLSEQPCTEQLNNTGSHSYIIYDIYE